MHNREILVLVILMFTPCQKQNDCKKKEHPPGTSAHRQQYAAFVFACGSKDPSQCRSSFASSLAVDPSLVVRCSNAVAEHTLALMMALSRRIEPASQAVKQGRFAERDHFQGVELAGKTLGVVGLGRVGRRVAQMAARGLGMVVVGYDPFIQVDPSGRLFSLEDSIEEVFEKSDFLTFHVPLTPETRDLGPAPGPTIAGCSTLTRPSLAAQPTSVMGFPPLSTAATSTMPFGVAQR